jgi:hypothetical protein
MFTIDRSYVGPAAIGYEPTNEEKAGRLVNLRTPAE